VADREDDVADGNNMSEELEEGNFYVDGVLITSHVLHNTRKSGISPQREKQRIRENEWPVLHVAI
jgi:hypothetical protein